MKRADENAVPVSLSEYAGDRLPDISGFHIRVRRIREKQLGDGEVLYVRKLWPARNELEVVSRETFSQSPSVGQDARDQEVAACVRKKTDRLRRTGTGGGRTMHMALTANTRFVWRLDYSCARCAAMEGGLLSRAGAP